MARPTSTARRELGDELRRLRGERRGASVAQLLGWSESKLSRIETARTGISEPDLDRLLSTYDAHPEIRDRLHHLARRGRDRVWWTPYRSSVPAPYDEFVALEAEAIALEEWETQIVPGLLQTDEYARAVIEVGAGISDPETIQRRLALRMARQTVLVRDPPPRLTVVLDESVLHREVGGPGVLRRQLQRLREASLRPAVELLVLPFSSGAHAAQPESFMILEFAGNARGPIVHSEGLTGGVFHLKDDEVRIFREAFDDVRARALDAERSRELITRSGERLRRPLPRSSG
ncbi:helix-turn-helix domain-containing protein [Actinoplanes sp. NPDC049265]|uniref:helix-turn-helix domain-containing protein n=1 Tax=Actinoplanes sp. NPDC049265 TaxID=3363902 RepID=UPI003716C97E